ncbi:MAG: peptidoglycan DD-metalloendopeptidase family protein [Patescibacteria group bacterium]
MSSSVFPALNTAHAGVFSFLASVFGDKTVSDSSSDGKYNSQNIGLLEAPLSSKFAVGGGDISIVDNTALEFQAESGEEPYQSDQISSYIVRDGDTLSQIAKMFNVSVNTIVWANDIERGIITPGQNLIILPVSGIKHIVKSGDTLQSITRQYSGDLKEILQFNDISADAKLAVGDEIIIPNGDSSPTRAVGGSIANSKLVTDGYYMRPIIGGRKTQGIHGYNGVDLAAPIGTRVVASAAGKIIVSKNFGYNGGYGKYIVISHPNGTQTLYSHLNETAVAVGTSVAQGQLIGYLGNTGRSTGPHVHFEIRGAKNSF